MERQCQSSPLHRAWNASRGLWKRHLRRAWDANDRCRGEFEWWVRGGWRAEKFVLGCTICRQHYGARSGSNPWVNFRIDRRLKLSHLERHQDSLTHRAACKQIPVDNVKISPSIETFRKVLQQTRDGAPRQLPGVCGPQKLEHALVCQRSHSYRVPFISQQ